VHQITAQVRQTSNVSSRSRRKHVCTREEVAVDIWRRIVYKVCTNSTWHMAKVKAKWVMEAVTGIGILRCGIAPT
jgi:hypothetical protein